MVGRRILNIIFVLLAALFLWGGFASRVKAPEHVISVGILASRDDEDFAGATALKEHVERRSQGRIAVKIYTSGQFCSAERECIEYLQSGVLDVFMTTFGGFGNFFPEGQAFELPYLYDNDAVAECVLEGPIVEELRTETLSRGIGIRLMTIGNTGGWRDFATVERPVRTPADLKGAKIRTTPAQLEQEMVRSFGANPTPIAFSELYLGLATGVVDGTKNSVQDIIGMRLEEYLKYVTVDHHAYMGAMWWYSDKRWSALPAELRPPVEEGFAELRRVTRAVPKERQAAAFKQFEAKGGEILRLTDGERAAFKQVAAPLRDWYVKKYGDHWLVRVDEAIAKCARAPSDLSG
jgi:tripartite ATP-independent transporter DctP family solute receptor